MVTNKGFDDKDVAKIFKVIRKEVRVAEARCKQPILKSKQEKVRTANERDNIRFLSVVLQWKRPRETMTALIAVEGAELMRRPTGKRGEYFYECRYTSYGMLRCI